MSATIVPLLKGVPVLVMRRGTYPNKSDVADIVNRLRDTHTVRTEYIGDIGCFAVTAQRRKS